MIRSKYFQPPNEIFLLGLSPGALAVCSYLLCCEKRSTYQCRLSYKTVGRAVQMSQNSICKYVREIEDKRLIRTDHISITTKDGRKRNGTLHYQIRPIQEAVDHYNDQQLQRLDAVSE